MPQSCVVVGCSRRADAASGISFHAIPKDPERRLLWIAAIRRKHWEPCRDTRVCGRHFLCGKPYPHNNTHPDYVPCLELSDSAEANQISRRNAERSLERFESTKQRIGKIEKQHELPRDHATYSRPLAEMPASYPRRSHLVDYPPVDKGTQTHPDTEVIELRAEVERLKRENEQLRAELAATKWSSSLIASNDSRTRFLTGLPSYDTFKALFAYVEGKASRMKYWSDRPSDSQRRSGHKLELLDEFFVVLVRLRHGLPAEFMAILCKVHETTIGRAFRTWVRLLSEELKLLFPYPAKTIIDKWMPSQFASYPNTRCIIDCTEFFIERPSSLTAQVLTFSSYKGHNTFKALIGVSPNGMVTYVSDLWGGRVSDRYITEHSGFLDLIERGDNIMADRGFNIEELLADRGATLNIPPFRNQGSTQLTFAQVEETRRIANVRIHVERCIGYAKLFRILVGVQPLSLAPLFDDIVKICFFLTNFNSPKVKS